MARDFIVKPTEKTKLKESIESSPTSVTQTNEQ